MKLTCASRELHARRAFRISRPRRTEIRNVFVRLEADGIAGYGEAAPSTFYGETWESVLASLDAARAWLAGLTVRSVADLEAAWHQAWTHVAPSRAAQCALDVALWDWLARRQGVTVAELAWGKRPHPVTTFCTIGLSTPEELLIKLEELAGFPRIKIKSDAAANLEAVRTVRARSDALLAVDANCAWATVELAPLARELALLRVDFIEQPFPPESHAQLALSSRDLPVIADESCVTEDDVARIAPHFAGFNIKLVKCGGLTPALRMVRHGRKLGRQLMIGCMLESSALIAAGAVIAQQTDYADLDGAWLIGDDPFRGWEFTRGVLTPPPQPGLGVEPEPGLFSAGLG